MRRLALVLALALAGACARRVPCGGGTCAPGSECDTRYAPPACVDPGCVASLADQDLTALARLDDDIAANPAKYAAALEPAGGKLAPMDYAFGAQLLASLDDVADGGQPPWDLGNDPRIDEILAAGSTVPFIAELVSAPATAAASTCLSLPAGLPAGTAGLEAAADVCKQSCTATAMLQLAAEGRLTDEYARQIKARLAQIEGPVGFAADRKAAMALANKIIANPSDTDSAVKLVGILKKYYPPKLQAAFTDPGGTSTLTFYAAATNLMRLSLVPKRTLKNLELNFGVQYQWGGPEKTTVDDLVDLCLAGKAQAGCDKCELGGLPPRCGDNCSQLFARCETTRTRTGDAKASFLVPCDCPNQCTPSCDFASCGQPDGCGRLCGCQGSATCVNGACCTPCDGVHCGVPAACGVGGTCGCGGLAVCMNGACCTPCDGIHCGGPDACNAGATCGCSGNSACTGGVCSCQPNCDGVHCGGGDGCGGACGCLGGGTCVGGTCSGASADGGACGVQQVAGGDAPDTRSIQMGVSSGTFAFSYDTYTQQDEIAVSYQGALLFDTGCVGASGSTQLSYRGSSTSITVSVAPNCAGGSGTAWNYTVGCPQ